MKKFYILLALLISLSLSLEIVASNLKVASKALGCSSIDGKGVATFEVTSPETQTCDLSFLIMPGEYEDGSFTSVTLKVNGTTLSSPITFNTYGWQSANTTGNAVTLNKGENTIQFISGRDDVPIVREVKVWNGENTISNIEKLSIISDDIKNINNSEINTRYIDNEGYYFVDPQQPLYRPGVQEYKKYCYTTSIDIYYENANSIAHFYAPTSWDPLFGMYESTIDYNAYLFYKADPAVYSKRFSTTNHYVNWQDTIPVAGEYCLILEPKNTNEEGWASIRINNSNLYRACYITQDRPIEVKRMDVTNNILVSAQDSIYNMFTTNNQSIDPNATHSPDPVLWLKERVITAGDTSDIIVAYNDNNIVQSDFDWGNNARIRTKLDSTKQYFLTLSSTLPYVQSSNPDICDLYHSYWNAVDSTNNPLVTRENVIYEDLIESANAGGPYNCYAWSAGIIYNVLSPVISGNNIGLEWFDLLYSNQEFHNAYGKTRRPSRSPIYTRNGATFQNAVVDLWGCRDSLGNISGISHATVRNPYSGIPNGYDWESKLGGNERVFHPRMADLGYGEIVAHYTLAPGQETVKYSYEGIVYSSVAEGEMIIEDVKLTEDEKSLLSQNIPTTYRVDRFEQYYSAWKEYAKTKFHYSDLEQYKDSIAYPRLINYILSNPGEEYKAYKKFDDGDYFSAVLIKDISSEEGTRAKEVWDKIMNAPLEGNIVRTSWGNVRLFIKTMLQDEEEEVLPQTGKIRSNEDDVEITAGKGEITVAVGLDKTSMYSIKAVNIQTTQDILLLPEITHKAGKEIYKYTLSPGSYIIAVVIDGNINAQKVIVK